MTCTLTSWRSERSATTTARWNAMVERANATSSSGAFDRVASARICPSKRSDSRLRYHDTVVVAVARGPSTASNRADASPLVMSEPNAARSSESSASNERSASSTLRRPVRVSRWPGPISQPACNCRSANDGKF